MTGAGPGPAAGSRSNRYDPSMADGETPDEQVMTVQSTLEIPGGAYAESSLLIVSYIDDDGNHKYAWKNSGEGSVATMIGLMEMIKLSIMVESLG